MIGIYKITNTINNKVYIGQSVNIEQRFNKHKRSKKNYPLYNDFKLYGIENFTFEILCECSKLDLTKYEIYFINLYDSLNLNKGYNQCMPSLNQKGGHGFRFSYNEIINIFNDLLKTNLSKEELAKKYNCCERTIRDINAGRSLYRDDLIYPIRKEWIINDKHYSVPTLDGIKINTICPICHNKKHSRAQYCKKCSNLKQQKHLRPDKQILLEEIYNFGFTKIAKKYGVTDNAIRKWCKNYGLPTHITEIKKLYQIENNIAIHPKKKMIIKKVAKIDPSTNQIISIYNSAKEAAESINKSNSHIVEVCNGKLKSAYGYRWKYIDEDNKDI